MNTSKRGRTPVVEIPDEKLRHLGCYAVRRFYSEQFPVTLLAAAEDVDVRTLYRFLKRAKGYDEANDPEYLRTLASQYLNSVAQALILLRLRRPLLAG